MKRSALTEHNSEPKCKKVLELPIIESENIEPEFTAYRLEEYPQDDSTEDATLTSGMSKPVNESEREILHNEIDNIRLERDMLRQQLKDTEAKLEAAKLSACLIDGDETKAKFYTGLSCAVFEQTFQFLNQFAKAAVPGSLSNKDQFFVTLVKLRLNVKFEHLSDQAGVSKTTVKDIFWKWVNLLDAKLNFLIQWPERETVRQTVPPVFKSKFPRLTNIIDCFEIFIENPHNLKARAQCYSHYKKHTTVKFLIACSPLGAVIFLSKAWGGRVSDVEITRKSGYISRSYHHPGDQILADRGFTLQEDLATECSAQLILPAFTKGRKQLSAQDVEMSRSLASVRIHVERVIGLMKSRYSILQGTLPIQLVNSRKLESEDAILSSVDKIVRSCAILTNLGDGIVYKNI